MSSLFTSTYTLVIGGVLAVLLVAYDLLCLTVRGGQKLALRNLGMAIVVLTGVLFVLIARRWISLQ